jgi:hypothetical protein
MDQASADDSEPMREEEQVEGGEALFALAVAEIIANERRATKARPTTPIRWPGRRRLGRSWVEILVAVVASAIVVWMVAAGGVSAAPDTDVPCLPGGVATCEPDPLIICHEIGGWTSCVREAT